MKGMGWVVRAGKPYLRAVEKLVNLLGWIGGVWTRAAFLAWISFFLRFVRFLRNGQEMASV